MRILIPFLSLILAHVATAAEEPAELVELRQGWEEARGTKQQRVDKLYFEELEELKKNFVKAGNIEAARAVDSAIKDSEKAGNEPQALLNMRDARGKSLKKAFTPIDKRYWKNLKKLRGDFQKQGSLAGIEATDAEIKKVLAAYKKPEPPMAKTKAKEKDETEFKDFDIEFVLIGNPGNEADDTGYGAVPYAYRISKYEISEAMIAAYNKRNPKSKIGGSLRGPDRPVTGVYAHLALRFINWLNTSQGHQAAYNFTEGRFEPWSKEDARQLGGENLLRHKDAKYFLPSENEWYKAAYYDPKANDGAGGYWDYATGSNEAPKVVASGSDAGTAVYDKQPAPAVVHLAGGLSPYGTMAQNGNVCEFGESAFDGFNNTFAKPRFMRGGGCGKHFWNGPRWGHSSMRDDDRVSGPMRDIYLGFRVASVTE